MPTKPLGVRGKVLELHLPLPAVAEQAADVQEQSFAAVENPDDSAAETRSKGGPRCSLVE